MGEFTTMIEKQECFDTRDAHVQVSIKRVIPSHQYPKHPTIWVNVDGVCRLRVYAAKSIEVEDECLEIKKEYKMSPFSGIVGCAIYRIKAPMEMVCMIPPQFTPHKDGTTHTQQCNCIKEETERIAKLVLYGLNYPLTNR